MLVKELILNSLETFKSFKIQYSYYKDTTKELPLTKQLYEKVADKEIDFYYLDIDEYNQPYISIKLEN